MITLCTIRFTREDLTSIRPIELNELIDYALETCPEILADYVLKSRPICGLHFSTSASPVEVLTALAGAGFNPTCYRIEFEVTR